MGLCKCGCVMVCLCVNVDSVFECECVMVCLWEYVTMRGYVCV